MRPSYSAAYLSLVLWLPLTLVWSKELSSQPGAGAKVCVAEVNNQTNKSLFVEKMTERLAKSLSEGKITAVVMESSTTSDRELHPTVQNGEELKRRECDYLVITQVSDPKANSTEPRIPDISIGRKVPSVDASDPMGGQSGPQYRDNLDVNFAVFRPGTLKAVLNTRLVDQPSASVSDSMMQAMDREASRIGHEIKKK
jgi:hypothetical protein